MNDIDMIEQVGEAIVFEIDSLTKQIEENPTNYQLDHQVLKLMDFYFSVLEKKPSINGKIELEA